VTEAPPLTAPFCTSATDTTGWSNVNVARDVPQRPRRAPIKYFGAPGWKLAALKPHCTPVVLVQEVVVQATDMSSTELVTSDSAKFSPEMVTTPYADVAELRSTTSVDTGES
jgi:hypothetical protein